MAVSKRNKIKSLWKKFKHWLIRKLGGYVAPTQNLKVEHIDVPVIKLSTAITFPEPFENDKYIKEALAKKLSQEIENYITIYSTFNSQNSPFEKTYIAEIEVVKRS